MPDDTVTVNAQTSTTIRVTGTRFTFPVFKKWISEYSKIHPEVKIIIASGIPADSADILIASHILKPGDVKAGQASVALAKYVQLPVVNNKRADLKILLTKGFTDASFMQIILAMLPLQTIQRSHFQYMSAKSPLLLSFICQSFWQ